MKVLLAGFVALVAAVAGHRPAAAVVACNNNAGFAPRQRLALPPHPQVTYFDDDFDPADDAPVFFARIGGKKVPVKVTTTTSSPYTFWVIEVDSDRTGTLTIGRIEDAHEHVAATYKIRANAKLPVDVAGTTHRFHEKVQHSSVEEVFDGLGVVLASATPALIAHVKLRRDAKAAWFELDAPVVAGDWMDRRTQIKLGALGCTENFTVDLLEQGVDIDVTVTLVDGTTRPVSLPAHVTL